MHEKKTFRAPKKKIEPPPATILGKRLMGGQNVSFDFGGGKRTIECALQNQFWRPEKAGFAWSVPVSSKENNRAKTNGGGENVS